MVTTFVSRSEIVVPVDEMPALERAFRERMRRVDEHDGFLGLELLRDVRGNGRYVLVTRWRDRASFVAYMKSGDHGRAPGRPARGPDGSCSRSVRPRTPAVRDRATSLRGEAGEGRNS